MRNECLLFVSQPVYGILFYSNPTGLTHTHVYTHMCLCGHTCLYTHIHTPSNVPIHMKIERN
jgi:hypothetical protein